MASWFGGGAASTADKSAAESSGSSWWGAIAKATEIVRKDLSEFVNTVSEDTTRVIAQASKPVEPGKGTATDTPSSASERTDTRDSEGASVRRDDSRGNLFGNLQSQSPATERPAVYNRYQAAVVTLQSTPGTYLNEPENVGQFNEWAKGFSLDGRTEDIARLLTGNPEMRVLHTKFVPEVISYTNFWMRYYFKVHVLDAAEERRAAIVQRASGSEHGDDEGDGWGAWDDDDHAEAPANAAPAAVPAVATPPRATDVSWGADVETPVAPKAAPVETTPPPVASVPVTVPSPAPVAPEPTPTPTVAPPSPAQAPAAPAPASAPAPAPAPVEKAPAPPKPTLEAPAARVSENEDSAASQGRSPRTEEDNSNSDGFTVVRDAKLSESVVLVPPVKHAAAAAPKAAEAPSEDAWDAWE